jgi:mono/diheme cytochrome c family protein
MFAIGLGLPALLVAVEAAQLGVPGLATFGKGSARGRQVAPDRVTFNAHVRPILSDNCFNCHGPDGAARKAGLRLDLEAEAKAELPENKGRFAIVPGDPAASELVRRIESADPKAIMPPPKSHKTLTPEQVGVLRRWIAEGAAWEQHWAFIPPARKEPPALADGTRPASAIDAFVRERLAHEGLAPNPPADRRTLIRRLHLDLTGLPPTPAEVRAFEADESPAAYENAVDRLLASPRYGEHMARYWLDAARYADTHGFHFDNYREIWPYRDWVVAAFNRNLPYDRFTIEQLAGDLLENATLEQKVASGFNRCNPTTNEGGIIQEEYLHKYGVDRVQTLGSVWLGLTVGCAECHDHRYDPISQRDFYRFAAYFNSTAEPIMDGNKKDTPPVLRVPTPDQQERMAEISNEVAAAEVRLYGPDAVLDAEQAAWEKELAAQRLADWLPLRPSAAASAGGATLKVDADMYVTAEGPNPAKDVYTIDAPLDFGTLRALRLDVALSGGTAKRLGRTENGNFVLSELEAEFVPAGGGPAVPLRLGRASASYAQPDFPVADAVDGKVDEKTGWAGDGHRWAADRTAVFALAEPLEQKEAGSLRLRLRFESQFPQHAIGRFRLLASSSQDEVEVALGEWYAAGPFPLKDVKSPRQHDFGPERVPFRVEDVFAGNVGWQPAKDLVDAKVFSFGASPEVMYFHRTVTAARPVSLPVYVGSDDAIKIFLNGVPVHEVDVSRAAKADEDAVVLNLPAGTSRLLAKVINYAGGGAFVFRAAREDAFARRDEVWIEDRETLGGKPSPGWNYVKGPAPVYSGQEAREQAGEGTVQHFFEGATAEVAAQAGDSVYAWVYLDPERPPRTLMLQFNTGQWMHRAYWGEDAIDFAKADGDGPTHRYIGPLPKFGAWARLEADASSLGIKPGQAIKGLAYTQAGGRAWWDQAGVVRQDPLDRSRMIAALPADARTEEQKKAIQKAFRSARVADYGTTAEAVAKLAEERKKLEAEIPSTMVSAELPQPRKTHLLIRGQYDQKGEEVAPGIPAVLPPMPADFPSNRLGLARWLVSSEHPLTARVAVNRIWQQFFGIGLVKTAEDFGGQGEKPMHQDLLDHLAVSFREGGWDVKALVRQIVMSETYRQSARDAATDVSAAAGDAGSGLFARIFGQKPAAEVPAVRRYEADPDNRFLARGPRFRMDAETIRDYMLAVSGLLVERIGGAPVRPYQPEGVWEAVAYEGSDTRFYKQDHGESLYRRSLYTFWKRTAPSTQMSVFDAPSREFCQVRRERTNTPLAALALMNDVQYVEAARRMAERILREGGASPQDRLRYAFELATCRPPDEAELAELAGYFEEQKMDFVQAPERAELLLKTGESPRDMALDAVDLAAWTMLSNLLLNLDETITKG